MKIISPKMINDLEPVSGVQHEELVMEGAVAASLLIPKTPNSKVGLEITVAPPSEKSSPLQSPQHNPNDAVESQHPPIVQVNINIEPAESSDDETVNVHLIQEPSKSDAGEIQQVLIDVSENSSTVIKLTVIVSMVSPFGHGSNILNHVGNFSLDAAPFTKMRTVKKGITKYLDICYEDMALVYQGKFLGDSHSFEYYGIDDGEILHLLAETPNPLFQEVFEAFKDNGLSEERAWCATHKLVNIIHAKYGVENAEEDGELHLSAEQLQFELDNLHIPDTDESDVSDSSIDEDEDYIDEIEYPPTVNLIGELVMISDEIAAHYQAQDILSEYHFSEDDTQSEDGDDSSDDDYIDDYGDYLIIHTSYFSE